MRLLVTGGCGFVGSTFIRYILQHYGPEMVTNVDSLVSGTLASVDGLAREFGERYEFLQADLGDSEKIDTLLASHPFFAVVNFASASETGAAGMASLLERARVHGVRRFVQVSNDRVTSAGGWDGDGAEGAPEGADRRQATADAVALEGYRKHKQEVVLTRAASNYGFFQAPGEFIPACIISALRDEPAAVPGDGSSVRDWLHVEDHCSAIFAALLSGRPGAIYHLAGGEKVRDIEVAQAILEHLGKSRESIRFAPVSKKDEHALPGDVHLAEEQLAWKPRKHLSTALTETVDWYVHHREWWEAQLR